MYKPMTQEQVNAFYHDLGDVCRKHGIQGLAGIWFSKGEEQGKLAFWNPLDLQTKTLVQCISEKWEQLLRDAGIPAPPVTSVVSGISGPQRDKN